MTTWQAARLAVRQTWQLVRTHPYLLACSPLLFASAVFREHLDHALGCSAGGPPCYVHRTGGS